MASVNVGSLRRSCSFPALRHRAAAGRTSRRGPARRELRGELTRGERRPRRPRVAFPYAISGWRERLPPRHDRGVLMILTPPLREYRRPGPVVFRAGPPPRYEPPREPEPFRRRHRIQRYLPGHARFTRVAQRVRRPLRRRG